MTTDPAILDFMTSLRALARSKKLVVLTAVSLLLTCGSGEGVDDSASKSLASCHSSDRES
jgi:hypothetical protein